jgi:hypothetical protein
MEQVLHGGEGGKECKHTLVNVKMIKQNKNKNKV